MRKALIYASVASMIQQFNMDNIRILLSLGYEVHVACNMEQGSTIPQDKIALMQQELRAMGVQIHHIPIPRNIVDVKKIWKSYKVTKKLLNEQAYDLIHCHSPIGSIICRLSNRRSQNYKTTRMIYTAHGFHFYKGAPLKNWLLYYPVEKLCSYYTDVLITINQEDYALAKKKMRAKHVEYVPGIGIDLEKFGRVSVNKEQKRKEIGVPEDAVLLLSVGELNNNKNHETVIRAIADMDVYYIIAGQGALQAYLQDIIEKLNIGERVKLLGFRRDIEELCKIADVFVFPSFREGLSVSVMEAMASGLPVVCSRIRGNTDMIDMNGGYLFDPKEVDDCRFAIDQVLASNIQELGDYNSQKCKRFSRTTIMERIEDIYIGKMS